MLLLDTSLCIIDVNNLIREVTFTLTSDSPVTLAERYSKLILPWRVESALFAYMVRSNMTCRRVGLMRLHQTNLGDVIILWRTFAFWHEPHERWVRLIPVVLLAGSFGESYVAATACRCLT